MHNRFRSKFAEVVFNKLNKNKKFKAESAGFLLHSQRLFVAQSVIEEANRRGYKIKGAPRQLTKELADKFDIIVVSADDLPRNFVDFFGKIIRWKIKDCSSNDISCIKEIFDLIEKKVKQLLSDLN